MRSISFGLLFLAGALSVSAQSSGAFSCTAASNNPVIHAEGVAERLGDIVLNCSGGTPGATVVSNFTLFSNLPVTNRISAENLADAVLTVNTGSGETLSNVPARLVAANQLAFNGFSVVVPASGSFSLRFVNVRADATRLGPGQTAQVLVGSNGPNVFAIVNPTVFVGLPAPSLYATSLGTLTCSQLGSPVPSTLTLANLLVAGSGLASTRLTEGFNNALHPRESMADNGVRIMARYTGFPAGARVFVPDVVAGANADAATSAGDFGVPANGGVYNPARRSLLLVRVQGADANGAGGTLAYAPGAPASGAVQFGSYAEVALAGGSGYAVYEVVDADASVRETAQIPSFLGLPRGLLTEAITPSLDIVLAPVSTIGFASSTAPVPRFLGGVTGPDCPLLGDCNGSWVPRLTASPDPLTFVLPQGFFSKASFIGVQNSGGGTLQWNASVEYKNGGGWLRLTPAAGINNAVIRVDALTGNLNPGKYEATVTVDAGLGGKLSYPVSVQITPAAADSKRPAVTDVIHAATYVAGPLVAGSIGTIKGSFAGTQRTLALDGIGARVLYQDDRQINFVVPAEIAGRPMAQLAVTVDNVAAQAVTVNLAPAAPGVFPRGILNQDNSVNEAANPALAGSVVQVFATGVATAEATIDAAVGSRPLTVEYAGAAPGIPGLQQINLRLPEDLGAGTMDLTICNNAAGQRFCAPAVKINVRR